MNTHTQQRPQGWPDNPMEFLLQAKEVHVFISLIDGRLKVKGDREALTPSLKQALAARKAQIIRIYEQLGISSNQQIAPSAFSQQRLWFLDQLGGNSVHYNMPSALRLRGDIHLEAIEQALNTIVERHESLRTVFVAVGDSPYQIVREYLPRSVSPVDLTDLPREQREQRLKQLSREESNRPFRLDCEPLLRWQILLLAQDEIVLLRTMHHIAADGWSMGVFNNEFQNLYRAFSQGQANPLAPLEVQFADYAHWQRKHVTGDELRRQLEFWTETLAGIPAVHSLPLDRPRPAVQSNRGKSLSSLIDRDTVTAFEELCRAQGATLFMGLNAAFALLLGRYSGQSDIVIGTPIANREQSGVERLIGFFLNTIVLRTHLDKAGSFKELLLQARQKAWDAYAHQQVPFEHLVAELDLAPSLAYSPVFQLMLILQNNDHGDGQLAGLEMETVGTGFSYAKFDLTLNAMQEDGQLFMAWNYNTDLFDQATIARMANNFAVLMDSVVKAPSRALSQLSMLHPVEYQHCTQIWNRTQSDFAKKLCAHQLFENRAAQSPDCIALVTHADQWSYSAINARANRLARALLEQGAGPGTQVGIFLSPGEQLLVAVLAVLKCGACYVPLDINAPLQRIETICRDADLRLLMGTPRSTESIGFNIRVLNPADEGRLCCHSEGNLNLPGLMPQLPAYMLYTSGSTGRPKGVLVSHHNLVAYQHACENLHGSLEGRRILQFSSFAFDIFAEEICLSLFSGATLVIRDAELLLGGEDFLRGVDRQKINIASLPTAFWHHLCATLPAGIQLPQSLTRIIVGGEAMAAPVWRRWLQSGLPAILLNTYGPTETTVVATTFDLKQWSMDLGQIPIGKPIANTRCYVLDADLRVCPVGAVGELCIAGEGLAHGYWRQGATTAQSFVPNPFTQEVGGERLYRTGDLVKYSDDGYLLFVGRRDHQVKVRGFRVELEDVEQNLMACEVVDAAAVIVVGEENDRSLVAYVGTKGEKAAVNDAEIYRFLRHRLPNYMLPSHIILLDSLPLTAQGKVDKRSLPAPDRLLRERVITEPEGEVEILLASLWQRVLGVQQLGRYDSFFALGGHSLKAIQLVSLVQDSFQVKFSVKDIFERPSLFEQAQYLVDAEGDEFEDTGPVLAASDDSDAPLSFPQQQLWFLSQLNGPNSVYNMVFTRRVIGDIDRAVMLQSLAALTERQEALRTRFVLKAGQPWQRPDRNPTPVELEQVETEAQLQRVVRQEQQYPFDLNADLLCRLRLLELRCDDDREAPGELLLLVNLHHSVSDAWSMSIFFRELGAIYRALVRAQVPALAPLPIQYRDYARWQQQRLQGGNLDNLLDFWRSELQGLPPLLALPGDWARLPEQQFRGALESFTVPPRLALALKQLSQDQGVTLFMTMISGFALLLARASGQWDFAIGTPVANRTRQETESLIGFFVNTLALRFRAHAGDSVTQLLHKMRDRILAAFAHQELPFEMLVKTLNPERNLSYSPVFQVMFAMQNVAAPVGDSPADRTATQDAPELAFAPWAVESSPGGQRARFDLTMNVREEGGAISGVLEYNRDLFKAETIRRFVGHYLQLLDALSAHQDCRIGQLKLLTPDERVRQLESYNAPTQFSEPPAFVHQRVQHWVERSPDAIAVT
ncbi:amino acid adenylation domain-containing protein, partial [Microbulbifer sp. TYP-18]|uniref:amino acid adenylation domain-containing protein n=1 Tax=Microbulbifer sp. TYP-18 TaxID=3230024 RepID=UPI0034C5DB02